VNNRAHRRLSLVAVFAAVGIGACTIVTGPPPAAGPQPASAPPTHAGAPAAPAEDRYQDNTWRPGGDLRSFDLPQGGPEACALACEKEPACYAYDYLKPEHASGGVARCTLKHNIPLASKSTCCVSGVVRPWK
jgi:hypothetical protein